jgi:lysozyme family protein
MKANFEACMAEVFKHEGGYVNDPHDPGGETNMGISKRSYPKENIRGMTRERAAQIYRKDFWDKLKCDDLPAGLDLVAFDAGVNSGPARGAKWLQQAVGVDADGKIGPQTIAAAQTTYGPAAVQRAIGFRLAFMMAAKAPGGKRLWDDFGKGWQRRCDEVQALAERMAMGQTAMPPIIPDAPPITSKPVGNSNLPKTAVKLSGLAWLIKTILDLLLRRK